MSRAGFQCGVLSLFLLFSSCNWKIFRDPPPAGDGNLGGITENPGQPVIHGPDLRRITLLGTNDIHGGVEPTHTPSGDWGGMAIWGGISQAIEKGLSAKYGEKAGVLILDAGDQFQGTLLSNFNEGELVLAAMNEIGYDAVVPGNHAYDFGPRGWLDDQINSLNPDQRARGVLTDLVGKSNFAFLSANTFYKSSIQSSDGELIPVDSAGCEPQDEKAVIDWSRAARLEFLKTHTIKTVAGVRVAIIGIDHPDTATMTTPQNVSDLCYAEGADAYYQVQQTIGSQADLFVMVLHNGETSKPGKVAEMVNQILARTGGRLDAVIAGHTHSVNNFDVSGVPFIQSGSGGKMFGRVDLVWDLNSRKLLKDQTRFQGGIEMRHQGCAEKTAAVSGCDWQAETQKLTYEGVEVVPDVKIRKWIETEQRKLAPVANQKLGSAASALTVHRFKESSLADAMTDVFRTVSGAEIAFMNSSGLRAPIEKGELTYTGFFRVIPFNNHGVNLGPMPLETLIKLLERSIKTCGSYGALMQSGLRVQFERDCTQGKDVDEKARLLRVETVAGEVLLDVQAGLVPVLGKQFLVATLDFLAAGGSGYDGFKGIPLVADLGVVREAMVKYFLSQPANFDGQMDGRWKEASPKR